MWDSFLPHHLERASVLFGGSFRFKLVAFSIIAASVTFLAVSAIAAPQASLTLTNCDAKYCFSHNNLWTLTKVVSGNTTIDGSGIATWTINATKDSSANATFTVHGGMTIYNGGSGPAPIGNIVVNLQKRFGNKWVSVAADVADATNGDAATSAKIASAASQEVTNGLNYVKTGQIGDFTETSGSGALEFTDASSNTVFSLSPQAVIPAGGSITLLYTAVFQTNVLPPAGESLRVESIVSFGNAGGRGGSGASTSNLDINGNGTIDADEANIRSVPCRVTMAPLPTVPEECNDSVVVDDLGPVVTGSVTTSNPLGFEIFPVEVNQTSSWVVSVGVTAGTNGGEVCNEATLDGVACGGALNVIVGYDTTDPLNPIPIYATYECAAAAEAADDACVEVDAGGVPPEGIKDGDYCSFSQGGLGGSGYPYNLLAANFASIYPNGVEVGIPGDGGFSMKFTTAAAVQNYLPAGGSANKLTADLTNPTSTSAGQFGGQVLALKLNIALSDAGATDAGFGDLYYCEPNSSLNGQTVRQILAAAEIAIGGGALPSGYTYSTLAELCANLDLSFDGKSEPDFPHCGVATAWAFQYLKITPCPIP